MNVPTNRPSLEVENSTKNGKSDTVPERFQAGWLDALDGRLSLARGMRERFAALTDDLGGADALSYAQRSLCERALWLEYWLASQERELAKGDAFDVGKWVQAANSLQGIYSKLGLQRQAREAPDLQSWLKQQGGKS